MIPILKSASSKGIKRLSSLLEQILSLFIETPLKEVPLSPPHNHAIHCLINFPFDSLVETWFPSDDMTFLNQLLLIFHHTISVIAPDNETNAEEELFDCDNDECLIPLILLMKKLAGYQKAKKRMRDLLMPNNINRAVSLLKGKRTIHAMIRAMNSSVLNNTRDFLCEFMVTLCNEQGI